jgi:hypothetical protein
MPPATVTTKLPAALHSENVPLITATTAKR